MSSGFLKISTASGQLISLDDLPGATLIARKTVPIYRRPVAANDQYLGKPNLIGYIKAGNPAGVLYSWTQANGQIWYIFQVPAAFKGEVAASYFYIPNIKNWFDPSNLKTQGVLTLQEKIEANKNWLEKAGDALEDAAESTGKGLKTTIIAVAAIAAAAWILKGSAEKYVEEKV